MAPGNVPQNNIVYTERTGMRVLGFIRTLIFGALTQGDSVQVQRCWVSSSLSARAAWCCCWPATVTALRCASHCCSRTITALNPAHSHTVTSSTHKAVHTDKHTEKHTTHIPVRKLSVVFNLILYWRAPGAAKSFILFHSLSPVLHYQRAWPRHTDRIVNQSAASKSLKTHFIHTTNIQSGDEEDILLPTTLITFCCLLWLRSREWAAMFEPVKMLLQSQW